MKSESILWMQNEDASKPSYLVFNGRLVEENEEILYQLANRKLMKPFLLNPLDKGMVEKYTKTTKNIYFQLGSGLFEGVAYRSCFLEKEKNETPEPFMFWKSSLQLNGFINDAITSASALGKTLDEKELKFVDKYIRRIRNRRAGFCVLAIVIILVIILLCICHGNSSIDNHIVNYIKM